MISTSALRPIIVESRALFLSKVNAPPSPAATGIPKTPPESPSIFHYSLPSPGLVSPLALFESLHQNEFTGSLQFPSVKPWVEQVEYRRLKGANSRVPSLEQISAHLSGHTAASKEERPPIPLPTFLRATSRMKSTSEPLDTLSDDIANAEITFLEEIHAPVPKTGLELEVITRLVPRSTGSSSTDLTEHNLIALNSRTLTGRDMMSKLKRRTAGLSADGLNGRIVDEDERRLRRISAPAELPKLARTGFEHPILSHPGAF